MDLLAAMRVYVRVVERGSLSAAARDLGLGQPAVSERIIRLEQHCGASLLRRNTRSLSVTDVGADFYESSREAVLAADAALAIFAKDRPLRGVLRIAAPHGVGETVLPPILLWMRDRHPQLKIDLLLNDRIVDPVTEGVDISLRLGDLGEGSFAARRLGHVRRLLVAAPAYLARHGLPKTPNDLVHYPFLKVSGLFNDERLPLMADADQITHARVSSVVSVSHWRALHAMLLGGAGIGVLQELACAADLASGKLTHLLPGFRVPGFDLHALYAGGRPLSPKVQMILSQLEERLPAIPR